jgi:hypothetical protein
MAGSRILDWKQFIGGTDNVISLSMFPAEQKSFTYNFESSVAGFTWDIDYQTVVIDQVSFNRNTGEPNYTTSSILGFFDVQQASVATYVDDSDAANGNVKITIPKDRYTGKILPDARNKVATTCFSVKWTDASTPPITNIHRYIITETYTAEVTIGDPTTETIAQGGYTAL